jgi:hypothetical protein
MAKIYRSLDDLKEELDPLLNQKYDKDLCKTENIGLSREDCEKEYPSDKKEKEIRLQKELQKTDDLIKNLQLENLNIQEIPEECVRELDDKLNSLFEQIKQKSNRIVQLYDKLPVNMERFRVSIMFAVVYYNLLRNQLGELGIRSNQLLNFEEFKKLNEIKFSSNSPVGDEINKTIKDLQNLILNESYEYSPVLEIFEGNNSSALYQGLTFHIANKVDFIASSASGTRTFNSGISSNQYFNYSIRNNNIERNNAGALTGKLKYEIMSKEFNLSGEEALKTNEYKTKHISDYLVSEIKKINNSVRKDKSKTDSSDTWLIYHTNRFISYLLNGDARYKIFISNDENGKQKIFSPYIEIMDRIYKDLFESSREIIELFDSLNGKLESDVLEDLKKINYCTGLTIVDKNLKIEDLKKDNKQLLNNNLDLNAKDYSDLEEESDITKLKYWGLFATPLNILALLPKYWTTGIIIVSPVKMPIVWLPISTFKTKTSLYTIFLTINGIVVFPVVWELKLLPQNNSSSYLKTLFKGTNQLIKQKTGVENLNIKLVTDNVDNVSLIQDSDPDFAKSSLFTKDDLPIPERMSLSNPLYLTYLDKFLSTAVPFMGL